MKQFEHEILDYYCVLKDKEYHSVCSTNKRVGKFLETFLTGRCYGNNDVTT